MIHDPHRIRVDMSESAKEGINFKTLVIRILLTKNNQIQYGTDYFGPNLFLHLAPMNNWKSM